MRLIFPGAQRLNRGSYEFSQLMDACRANNVTDFLVVHEHRGIPDGLIVCHLPHGPTAYFTLSDIVMRHDIPDIGEWRKLFSSFDKFLLNNVENYELIGFLPNA
jgi:U3 small nucleolar ribonucleoprotein protein IMP4